MPQVVIPEIGTTAPLASGATFTSDGYSVVEFSSLVVSCKTDKIGIIYVDLSTDNTNWDSTLSYEIAADINEVHRITITKKFARIRFTNTDATAQTYLRLQVLLGEYAPLNTARNASIQADADAVVVRAVDAEIDIAQGLYVGYSITNKFGYNADIDSGSVPEDIWEGGGVYTGFPDSTAETVDILSSSAADTAAGTGARTVRIIGLDSNYDVLQETITLNGTTPATSVGVYRRVHTASVTTAGSGGVNVGTITIRHTTTTANVFQQMQIGRNQTNSSGFTVPAGYTGYLRAIHSACDNAGAASLIGQLWARSFNQPFRSRRPFFITNQFRLFDVVFGGLVFTEKSDIIVRIVSSTASNLAVNGGYDLLLVKNNA